MNDSHWSETLDRLKTTTQLRTLEGGRRSREQEYLTQRTAELAAQEHALKRREARLREAWWWYRVAAGLFGLALLLAMAGAPVFLQWADHYWRAGR